MNRRSAIFFLTPTLLITTLSFCFLTHTAEARATQSGGAEQKTVWNGVYTEAEAKNGQAVYEVQCKGCHGPALEGQQANPPLKGPKFMEKWREDNLNSLFSKMRALMPRRDPGSLSDPQYLGLVAYILQSNGFPTGSNVLNAGSLRSIQIEEKDGPKPLPNKSMVQIDGCLAQVDEDNWKLTKAPLPRRTADTDATPQDLKDAAARPLGSLSFQLQNLTMLGAFEPEAHKGQRMLAKGLLLRQASGDRISLTAMEMVSGNCGQ